MEFFLKLSSVGDGLHLLAQMIERLDEKAAGTGRRIKDRLPQTRIGYLYHEAHDRTRRIELP